MATKEPWERENPKPKRKSTKLSKKGKSEARKRAKNAGRPYPNLVDNMAVAKKKSTKKKSKSKKSTKKKSKSKSKKSKS